MVVQSRTGAESVELVMTRTPYARSRRAFSLAHNQGCTPPANGEPDDVGRRATCKCPLQRVCQHLPLPVVRERKRGCSAHLAARSAREPAWVRAAAVRT